MYRILKVCHLIGLTLFLGSILGHLAASVAAGEPGSAGFLYAREQMAFATRVLTLPGLFLAVASGIALAKVSRQSPLRVRWLEAKVALTVAIAINSIVFVAPAGARVLAETVALSRGEPVVALAQIVADRNAETIAGAANIVMILAIVLLGVIKPRLALSSRRTNGLASGAGSLR
jgi:Predicted integral membrane protein (DUF2269)